MSKRPAVDLSALTSEAAAPMAEASQRTAHIAPAPVVPIREAPRGGHPDEGTKTANLQALAFKVSPAFRKRFRQRAANADLKLNELLFAALDAWEEKQGLKK
jgi:hypothetical protein